MTTEEFRAYVRALESADKAVRDSVRNQKALPGSPQTGQPLPMHHHKPKVTRMVSKRQRSAFSQTDNGVKAIYDGDSTPTPVRPTAKGLTLNVGGNCEPLNSGAHGKDTRTRRSD